MKNSAEFNNMFNSIVENTNTNINTNTVLNISEIFYSIQGEGTNSGLPCVFVRLAGCNLDCSWCDTKYARSCDEATVMTFDEILNNIKYFKCNFVEITGGEPLAQPQVADLINNLLANNYIVAIETNGSISIANLPKNMIKIIDIKCPSSSMSSKNLYSNFGYITEKDEIKFVVSNEEDFFWADEIINNYNLLSKTKNILFSPVSNSIEYKKLADLILKTNSNYRMQLQLHKIIWGDDVRGV